MRWENRPPKLRHPTTALLGVFSGPAPAGLTLVPALFGTAVITIVVSMLFFDEPAERFLLRRLMRLERWLRRAAALPRSPQSGLCAAIALGRC